MLRPSAVLCAELQGNAHRITSSPWLSLSPLFFFFLHHIKSQVTGGEGVSSEGTELCIYDPDLPTLTFFFLSLERFASITHQNAHCLLLTSGFCWRDRIRNGLFCAALTQWLLRNCSIDKWQEQHCKSKKILRTAEK